MITKARAIRQGRMSQLAQIFKSRRRMMLYGEPHQIVGDRADLKTFQRVVSRMSMDSLWDDRAETFCYVCVFAGSDFGTCRVLLGDHRCGKRANTCVSSDPDRYLCWVHADQIASFINRLMP